MPALVSHLDELLEKGWFTSILDQEDSDNIQKLAEYLDFANNVMMVKNFTTGKKSYMLSLQGSPTFFKRFRSINSKLLERLHLYITEFDSKDLKTPKSELFFFETILVENSYDPTNTVRMGIKTIMNSYFSYDQELLDKRLDAFDGGTATFIDAIRVDYDEQINSALCYELGTNAADRDYERNKEVFKKISSLYGFSNSLVEKWIQDFEPILKSNNIRICYQLRESKVKQPKVLEVLFLPIGYDVFMSANITILENLKSVGLLNEMQFNDLKDWNDYTLRTLSHFNVKLSEKNKKISTEVSAFYGLMLRDQINPPLRYLD